MKLLPLLLALAGCGNNFQYSEQGDSPYAGIGIDTAFFAQVEAFEVEWGQQVTNIDMFFVDRIAYMDDTVIGACIIVTGGSRAYQRVIQVDRAAWGASDDADFREILIFHELGHCALNRGHNNALFVDNTARSIMNAVVNPVLPAYRERRQYYVNELFGRPTDN